MPRAARIVVPGYPHHVIQRGNKRRQTFFTDADYAFYLECLRMVIDAGELQMWAYCLMPNHVHLVMVPARSGDIASAMRKVHIRYSRCLNEREGAPGHLWQGRFRSYVMDEHHLHAAVRYIELNPVRAGLVDQPGQWRWSSARAHLSGQPDGIVDTQAMLSRVSSWGDYLKVETKPELTARLRAAEFAGKPLGDAKFIRCISREIGVPAKRLTSSRRGRKKGGRIPEEPELAAR